jgi:hypothetical protein
MRGKRKPKIMLLVTSVLFFVLALTGPLGAMEFNLGNETKLDCDVSLTYGAGWRVKDRELNSIAMKNQNYNDAGWNFDQWDMINNKGTIVADIDVSHKNFGVFVRPKAFYDHVYMTDNSNSNDPRQTINNTLSKGNKYDEWDDEVEDVHGANAEILDIFAYSSFDIGSRVLEVRVGRQVINWGESLFFSGGISGATTYMDLPASVSPGVELKEVYLPAGAVFGQINLFENLALSSFYQWEWQKNRFFEAGSFFSTRDTLDETGFSLSNAIPRGKDDEPRDSGQYGVAAHSMVQALNNTEFGLYFCNYHEKWVRNFANHPGLSPLTTRPSVLAGGTYPLQQWMGFAEDVKMYGASFSTEVWDANIAGETSYHQGAYIRTVRTGTEASRPFYYEKGNYAQAQVSAVRGFSDPKYCDSSTIAAEVAINRVMALENSVLFYDKQAWGYKFTYSSTWLQVLQDLDLKVPITLAIAPNGDSSVTGSFTEGSDTIGYGLEFTFKNLYLINIRYTDYLNALRNERVDRDYASVDIKYTF